MRWLIPVLFIPFVALVAADEAPPVDLGGRFAPAAGTSLRWTTRTEMNDGTYAGVRGVVPMQGKVSKVDEREVLTTYLADDKREVLVAKGQARQAETFGDKTEEKVKKMALEGVPLIGRLTDGKWNFIVAVGEATDEQKPELERLARRTNEEVDLFKGLAAKVGDTLDLDGATFLKAAGFDDVTKVTGTARATLKELRTTPDGPEAVITLQIDLQAVQSMPGGGHQRLRVKYTGQITRMLTSKLDRVVDLEGTMLVGGELVGPENQRTPYTLSTPVKLHSEREIIRK